MSMSIGHFNSTSLSTISEPLNGQRKRANAMTSTEIAASLKILSTLQETPNLNLTNHLVTPERELTDPAAATADKVKDVWQKLGAGVAKVVFGSQNNGKVLIIPTVTNKAQEIKDEVTIAAAIKGTLEKLATTTNEPFNIETCCLAIDIEAYTEAGATQIINESSFVDKDGNSIKVNPTMLWKMERGEGDLNDLEGIIEKANLTPEEAHNARINVAKDILTGFVNLAKAGYVHGDIKQDNVLIFKKTDAEGKTTFHAKLADFGKTKTIKPKEVLPGTGNQRTGASHQGSITSEKSEVMSAGLLLASIFAAPFVANKSMSGIEDFWLKTENSPAIKKLPKNATKMEIGANALHRGFKLLADQVINKLSLNNLTKENTLLPYIEDLQQKLKSQNLMTETQRENLSILLQNQTSVDPEKRPNPQEALLFFEANFCPRSDSEV